LGEPCLLDRPPLRQGEGLVAVHLRTENGADRIEDSAEARRGGAVLKPRQRAVTLVDPSMILLQMVMQGALGPVAELCPEHRAERPRIGVMPLSRDPGRRHPRDGPCRAAEGLGRLEVSGIAEPGIDQVPIPLNGPLEGLPLPLDPHRGRIDRPAPPHHPITPLA
jgi:hypothetical protein